VVRHGEEIEDIEAIGPTATVDPTPMIDGPWWGDSPWFTDAPLSVSQLRYLAAAGFPPARARIAADALRRLLPRTVCLAAAADHSTRMLIAPLYQTFVPYVTPLLALGCDLAEAKPWEDEHLLKRLLIPSEHWGAATEVAVGAALQRSGLNVDREPRGRDNKRPEYVVHLNNWRYFVEVKTNPDSLAETRADELQNGLMWLHGDLAEFGCKVAIRGSNKLHRLLMDPAAMIPKGLGSDLRADLRRYLAAAKTSGGPIAGRHAVGDYLTVEVGEDIGSVGTSVSLIPEVTDEKSAYRIIRKIREAATQMPRAGSGMAVVEVGSAHNLAVLHDALCTAFAATPAAFEPIRAVVFHVGVPTESGHRLRRVFGGPAPGRRLDATEQKLLRALLLPRFDGGEVVKETLYGTGTSRLHEFTIEPSTGGGPR